MKKLVLIAAVTIASASAYASKARLDALSNAAHLSDTKDIIAKPDQAVVLPEFATVNFGDKSGGTSNAEGGMVRRMDGSAWGLYLGSRPGGNAYRTIANGAIGGTNVLNMENGINFLYAMDMGDLRWGAGLFYSKTENKRETATLKEQKQDASGLYASVSSTAGWDAQLSFGLANNASFTTVADQENKLKGNTTYVLSGGYWMDTMYIYAAMSSGGAKVEQASTTLADRKDSSMKVGVINSHKKDGTDFFYGAELLMVTKKEDADAPLAASLGANITKQETTTLPLIIGVEHEAMSWLTLRASLTQNFLYSVDKTSAKNGAKDGTNNVADNTAIAAGTGLKFNKLTFDATLKAATSPTGTFGTDGTNFMAAGAMTYYF